MALCGTWRVVFRQFENWNLRRAAELTEHFLRHDPEFLAILVHGRKACVQEFSSLEVIIDHVVQIGDTISAIRVENLGDIGRWIADGVSFAEFNGTAQHSGAKLLLQALQIASRVVGKMSKLRTVQGEREIQITIVNEF